VTTHNHIVIPDTQVAPGVPTIHLAWAGQYIHDEYASRPDTDLTLIHVGDHWTMDSLNSYDKRGSKRMEGRRYDQDVDAGNQGFNRLNAPIWNDRIKRKILLRGNHEDRITRRANDDAVLDGTVSLDDLDSCGWETHDFLEVVTVDGVAYSHYFANPNTGRPYGGQSMDTRLKTVGYPFTAGHEQGLKVGIRSLTNGHRQRALIAGSFYLHDEDYLGPQGNSPWHGILVCHQVNDGNYDLMEVSMDYLCRRYEGIPLATFRKRRAFRG
jgi:hypothetical protein